MKPIISDIRIVGGHYNGQQLALCGSDADGIRYHVWLNPNTLDVGERIYKNCPLDAEPNGPGFFHTRYLRTDSKTGRDIVDQLLTAYDRDGLLDKYRQHEIEKANIHAYRLDQQRRDHKVRDAAPVMLAALKKIVSINGSTGGYKSMVSQFKSIASTAIAEAEPEGGDHYDEPPPVDDRDICDPIADQRMDAADVEAHGLRLDRNDGESPGH